MMRLLLPVFATVLLASSAFSLAATPSPDEEWSPDIDPAEFVEVIDNHYLPLVPGTTFHYEGEVEGEALTSTYEVTTETREVMGVTCVVVRDTVSVEGEVVEDTYDWFAQDKEGNVWYFGEVSQDIEDGEVVSTEGSWEAGVDGAMPGILVPGDPKVGDVFWQEYAVGIAEDKGEVIETGASLELPFGTFDDVLVIKEWNPLEPEVIEHKYYAPGVGMILSEAIQGEDERVELVGIDEPGS
jgi:hypothetical protein